MLLGDESYPGINVTATNTIYHSSQYPSYIEVPVVNKHQLPEMHGIQGMFEEAYPDIDYNMVITKGPEFLQNMMMTSHEGY